MTTRFRITTLKSDANFFRRAPAAASDPPDVSATYSAGPSPTARATASVSTGAERSRVASTSEFHLARRRARLETRDSESSSRVVSSSRRRSSSARRRNISSSVVIDTPYPRVERRLRRSTLRRRSRLRRRRARRARRRVPGTTPRSRPEVRSSPLRPLWRVGSVASGTTRLTIASASAALEDVSERGSERASHLARDASNVIVSEYASPNALLRNTGDPAHRSFPSEMMATRSHRDPPPRESAW